MENLNLCIKCKERPIKIKKLGLCTRCYQRVRNDSELGKPYSGPGIKSHLPRNPREIDFIKNYFRHSNWVYEPTIFYLPGSKYIPDFYDAETGAFIEVIGTPQAFYQNKEKYELFRKTFPGIILEFRTVSGELIASSTSLKGHTKQCNLATLTQ